jgi:hypothetical protein
MKPFIHSLLLALGLNFSNAIAQTDNLQTAAFFVNDEIISEIEYAAIRKSATQGFDALWKEKAKQDLPALIKFDEQQSILRQIILSKAIEQDALRVGFDVTETELTEAIYSYRRSLGLSSIAFRNNLEKAGFSEASFNKVFRQQMRSQLRVQQIVADTSISDQEREFYFSLFDKPAIFTGANLSQELSELFERSLNNFKANGILEDWIAFLRQQTQVRFPTDTTLEIYNPVVARVANTDIFLQDLNDQLYFSAMILDVLEQPQDAQNTIQKELQPMILKRLIDQALAAEFVAKSVEPFFGTKIAVLEEVKRYQGRNATITPQEAQSYYKNNLPSYKQPAQANVTILTFKSLKDANAFRTQFTRKGGDVVSLAKKLKARVNQFGRATEDYFIPDARKAIFKERLTTIRKIKFTRNIKDGKETVIVIVNDLKPASLKPFQAVQNEITERLKSQKQSQLGEAWLKAARKANPVENHLLEVQAQINQRLSGVQPSEPVIIPTPEPIPNTPEPMPTPTTPIDPPPTPPSGLFWMLGRSSLF